MAQELDVPIGPEQSHRARRTRHGSADALSCGPSMGRVLHPRARRSSRPQISGSRGRSSSTARRPAFRSGSIPTTPSARSLTSRSRTRLPWFAGGEGAAAAGTGGDGSTQRSARTTPLGLAAGIDGLGHRRCQVLERDDGGAAQAASARADDLVEVSRSRCCVIRGCESASGDDRRRRRERAVPRKGRRGSADSAHRASTCCTCWSTISRERAAAGEMCCWTTALVKVTVTN